MNKTIQIIVLTLIITVTSLNAFAIGTLKVQISEFPPCIIVEDGSPPTGFDIEIWNAIAKKQGWNLEYEVINPHTSILNNLKDKKTDVGIAAFTITEEREKSVDFSHHYLDSGLRILTLKKDVGLIDKIKVFWVAIKTPATLFIIFLLIFAHLIWLLERDDDPDNDANGINDNYFPGIFEALYFCIVTCSTVGYGDYTPKKWMGRLVVVSLIFAGIIAFCNFTALLSSEYTTENLSAIKSVEDLRGKTVITQKDTTAVRELKELGAIVKEVSTIEQACDWLLLKRGDALVFDAPVIMEYVKKYPDEVEIVGSLFAKQYYGFALQEESPLRQEINKALLSLRENGEYQKIYNKWFEKE